MKLHARKLALATAVVAAVPYVACWLIVAALPAASTTMTENMLHMQLDHLAWKLTARSLIIGAVAWALSAGGAVWLVGMLYNRMCRGSESAHM